MKNKGCLLSQHHKQSHSQPHTTIYVKQTASRTTCNKMETIIQHLHENNENEYYISDDQDDYFEPYDHEANSNSTRFVNTILSGTARLNALLPTSTILAFTVSAPLLTSNGKCTTAFDRWLTGGTMLILAACSVFFPITDSFRAADGRLCYGVATFHGIRVFGRGQRACRLSDYRLGWGDLFHASLSLVFFLAFASLQNSVLGCFHLVLPGKIVTLGPFVVGFVICFLFVLFPSTRRGVGYPFIL